MAKPKKKKEWTAKKWRISNTRCQFNENNRRPLDKLVEEANVKGDRHRKKQQQQQQQQQEQQQQPRKEKGQK